MCDLNLSLDNVPDVEVQEEILPIYKKAENFNHLNLVSGATIDEPVESYIRNHYGTEGIRRYKTALTIFKQLKLRPADDMMLAISSTKKTKIIIATAGAGKTTLLQASITIYKVIDKLLKRDELAPIEVANTGVFMSRILYLNYNKHNVNPCSVRHKQMCATVNQALYRGNRNSVSSKFISDDIESSTVHAFCHRWLTVYCDRFGLAELTVMPQEKKEVIWNAIIAPRWKKFYALEIEQNPDMAKAMPTYEVLDNLYTIKVESMRDWDEFEVSAEFVDTGLNFEFVKSCIKKYDGMKKQLKLIDFTDYLLMMIELLKNHEDARNKILSYYKLVIADEAQDFTALMNELLILLTTGDTERIIVGDPDQTIYDFKGVSPDNIAQLSKRLPDVDILGLNTNYRCPDKIIEAAKRLLDLNILRYKKPIEGVRTGGRIISKPCSDKESQIKFVMRVIESIPNNDLSSCVIAYRNNDCGIDIAEALYYNAIPTKIVEGRRPFQNPVFRGIYNVAFALYKQDDYEFNKELFRVLPMSREQWINVLEYNRDRRILNIQDLKFPVGTPRGTDKCYAILRLISQKMASLPISEYMGSVFEMYTTYFFKYMCQNLNEEQYARYQKMFSSAVNFFRRNIMFSTVVDELQTRNVNAENGVVCSTFHGLKGLEFKTVIAIDFMEDVFPRYSEIDLKYIQSVAMERKEAENRLCYVLVTRAMETLYLVYSGDNPSRYVDIILNGYNDCDTVDDAPLDLSSPSTSTKSASSFIRRMVLRKDANDVS